MTDSRKPMQKDVLVIGGGAIGLAIAFELALRGITVGVLSRSFSEAALHAAAGMLAPQAEAIAPSPMLDLCLQSRALYPDWVNKLEGLTGMDCGYWPCGILVPQTEHSTAPPYTVNSHWCDRARIDELQSGLGESVIGAWWHPDDGQVNNKRMAEVLHRAALQVGVNLREGVAVEAFHRQGARIAGLQTSQGIIQAQHYVLATGAWSNALLPIPVQPRKGQMLAIRTTEIQQPLRHVLFGEDVYIVPRKDGQIVIGATSEDVGFMPHNTPAGVQTLLKAAINLYPPLADWQLEQYWWGFRPTTPDELPILGASPYQNLSLATGHHRNGILLTPVTAQTVTDAIVQQNSDHINAAFRWDRF
jgi:thiazole synthase